ncbi:hypothetical protein AKO1_005058, partial [Acrasis kona]
SAHKLERLLERERNEHSQATSKLTMELNKVQDELMDKVKVKVDETVKSMMSQYMPTTQNSSSTNTRSFVYSPQNENNLTSPIKRAPRMNLNDRLFFSTTSNSSLNSTDLSIDPDAKEYVSISKDLRNFESKDDVSTNIIFSY